MLLTTAKVTKRASHLQKLSDNYILTIRMQRVFIVIISCFFSHFRLQIPTKSVISSSIGCLIATAKNAMTVETSSRLLGDVITVEFVDRFSVIVVATKKSLESLWAIQVLFVYYVL